MVDVHGKLASIRQMMSDVDGFLRRGPAAFRLVTSLVDEIDESLKGDLELGKKMIEYIEQEAAPHIGEYGTVSIGKATVQAIGRMKKAIDKVWTKFGIESDTNIVDVATRLEAAATRLAEEKRVLEANLKGALEVLTDPETAERTLREIMKTRFEPAIPDDPERPHIVHGEFQSDKYPKTPRGKVPLSVKDGTAQDLLWEYAQRRRSVDSQFSSDLEFALRNEGFTPQEIRFKWDVKGTGEQMTCKELFVHEMTAYGTHNYRRFTLLDMLKVGWYTSPPWLKDATEALGLKNQTLNWTQLLQEIAKLKRLYDEGTDSLAMSCIEPNPDCQCAGCSYARAYHRNQGTKT